MDRGESGPAEDARDEGPQDFAARAVAAAEAGDLSSAEAIARAGIAAAPSDPAWMAFTLAWVLQLSDRHDEAEAEYRRAITLDPAYASAHHNLGNTLRSLNRPDEAIAAYRRVLKLEPDHAQVHSGLARAWIDKGALDQAIAEFDQHLAKAPDDPDAHVVLSLAHLQAGDFEAGLPHYEYRAATTPEAISTDRRWDGGDLDGRSILLWAEQRLGDTIHFVRYAAQVAAKGGRVLLQVQPGLGALCRTAPGVDRVVTFGKSPPAHDRHARLLSLPLLAGTTLDNITNRVPYLSAEPDRVAAWRDRLAGPPGLKVGLAWQGKPGTDLDVGRSIPLSALLPLARVPGVRLISLQKHHGREQLAGLPKDLALEDYTDEMDEGPDAFLDTAAVMENLDLVITSDTAIPHLAGALRRPVWLLLKRLPEWRWLLRRQDSPWYPTLRLFRQIREGDWTTVAQRVDGDLARLAQGDQDVLRPESWQGPPARSPPAEDQ